MTDSILKRVMTKKSGGGMKPNFIIWVRRISYLIKKAEKSRVIFMVLPLTTSLCFDSPFVLLQ